MWADLPTGRFGLTHRPSWVITQNIILGGWIPRIRVVFGWFSGKSGASQSNSYNCLVSLKLTTLKTLLSPIYMTLNSFISHHHSPVSTTMADIALPSRSTPLAPRLSPPKRPRASTTTVQSMLLPSWRKRRAPPLKPTNSFMFTGLHLLYCREVIDDRHDIMTIYCTQAGCQMVPKVINRSLSGTNNYKTYYKQYYKSIPCTKEEADLCTKAAQEKKSRTF